MLEHKMKMALVGLGALLAVAGGACENKLCFSADNTKVEQVEQGLKDQYAPNSSEYAAAVQAQCADDNCCREGCTYDPQVECCWCPD